MNEHTQTTQFDERVDRYLLGKMTEAEELEFEIEYLDNPGLLAEVEMVERLIRGLKLNENLLSENATPPTAEAKPQKAKPGFGETLKNWLGEWFTPQTGWGAVAATVVLVPALTVLNPNQQQSSVQGTYVHILGQKVRSSTKIEEVINIEPGQNHLVVGFTTEPSFGVPDPITVKVFNENNQLVWQQAELLPDYRWNVYLSITSDNLEPGLYRYELTSQEAVTGGGEFTLQYLAE